MQTSNFEPKSDAARVRNALDFIEESLAKEAKQQDVYEWLKKERGLTITFKAFQLALYRERQKRKARDKAKSQATTGQPATQWETVATAGIPKALAQLSAPESTETDETKPADTKAASKAAAARYKALAAKLVDNPDY